MAAVNFPCRSNSRGAGSALDLLTACRGLGSLEEGDAVSCPSRCLRLWQRWGLWLWLQSVSQACGGNEPGAGTAAPCTGPSVSTRQPCSHACGDLVLIWSFLLPEPRLVAALGFPGTYCQILVLVCVLPELLVLKPEAVLDSARTWC